jgi:hypothetical protein
MKPQVQRPVLRPPWRHAFLALRLALIAFTLFVHLMWWRSIEQRRTKVDAQLSADAVRRAEFAAWEVAARQAWRESRLATCVTCGQGTTLLTGDATWANRYDSASPVPHHLEVWGGPVRAIIRCETLDQTRDCAFVPP